MPSTAGRMEEATMIFCTGCGERNDDGTQYCINCGSRLPLPQPQNPVAVPSAVPMPGVRSIVDVSDPADDTTRDGKASVPSMPDVQEAGRGRTIMLLTVAAVAVIFGAVLFTLAATVFSARHAVNEYMAVLADGDFDQANGMAMPDVKDDARALLVSQVASNVNNRITDVQVSAARKDDSTGRYEADVTYSAGGVRRTGRVAVVPDGRRLLLFRSWRVVSPLTVTLKIAVPKTMSNVSVNGVDIDLSKASTAKDNAATPSDADPNVDYGEMAQYSVPAYPAVYHVDIADSAYVTSDEATIADPSRTVYLIPKASDKLKKAILDKVRQRVDECTSSNALAVSGCGFSNGDFTGSSTAYTGITRTVSGTPELADVDIMTGTFTTATIRTTITYQRRDYADRPWENGSSTDSGTLRGTFSLENENLTVTIPNDDSADGE
ncbi:zinc ribbon domain-containing protein [Bifidobacterium sp. 82T24]|uniref:zinc-ribbon domain-containing protein n=1 Tax=Bifidobacterium pluvialisilvae TaxID=2834436 RepID=UPI001C5925E3|nr:zinc ribbon domain-containing protein [Bifidobacterium pluvialisilvae]MBW3088056.1 zinc ribbon domain-containing protein [Bifidobacterium pluvialisilvae]